MNCTDYEMLILDQLEGMLEQVDENRLNHHLASCESCQQFHASMVQQGDLFQQIPAGIVPPMSVVGSVMNRIQHQFPQHNHATQHTSNHLAQAAKTTAKIAQTLKAHLFIVLSSSVIVGAGTVATVVVLNQTHSPSTTIATPSPSAGETNTPKESDSNALTPINSTPKQSEGGAANNSETPVASDSPNPTESMRPSETPQSSDTPSPSSKPIESSTPRPSPTPSTTPAPSPSPTLMGTTHVDANIDDLSLGWKIPNLDDTKVIYIHKDGVRDATLQVEIVNTSYHPQDPNNIYMNGSGAAIRVVQFYNEQFVELEIKLKTESIKIWVDLMQSDIVHITGNN